MSLRWPSWLVQDVPEGHPDALGSLDALERDGAASDHQNRSQQ